MSRIPRIPLPKRWPQHVKTALIHTISLAATAFIAASGRASNRKGKLTQLQVQINRAHQEIALLKEEIRLKDRRFSRVSSQRRPYYRPVERLQILQLKAARGWSTAQTAKVFHLNEQTVVSWLERIDEEGEKALLQMPVPVNKFPDFVRAIVRQLKAFFPKLGKDHIAKVLARAGLHLGVTTAGRMVKDKALKDADEEIAVVEGADLVETRIVTSKYPGHVLHADLTVVPTSSGFWVPWLPHSWSQVWPFCWWVAVVIDHFSRSAIGFAIFKKKPTSLEIRSFLGRAISKAGKAPRHLITDKDSIFFCDGFKRWCKRKDIRPRYGAVGKHGSISVVERFIKTLKNGCTREILVPLRLDAMRREVSFYCDWYNQYRPHSFLEGRTPCEVYDGLSPANAKPRFEPRPHWPRGSPCASPQAKIKGETGARLVLIVGFFEGRRHLPVIELRRVA